jgi:hypothetical protein
LATRYGHPDDYDLEKEYRKASGDRKAWQNVDHPADDQEIGKK